MNKKSNLFDKNDTSLESDNDWKLNTFLICLIIIFGLIYYFKFYV